MKKSGLYEGDDEKGVQTGYLGDNFEFYVGGFKNDLKNGFGLLKKKTGYRYGQFKDGKLHGRGVSV